MKLNSIIVDDDPIFRMMLKKFVEQDEQRLALKGVAKAAEEAQELFKGNSIDLIFLDVGLPGMSGFDLMDSLESNGNLQIILVTGHEKYALDAFEYDVVDYLVKPIRQERFDKAVAKAMRSHIERSMAGDPRNHLFAKLVRFLNSRDKATLEPIPMRMSKTGYAYPMLSANFEFEREEKLLDLLRDAETDGLLTSEFVDAMYVCNRCSNSLLHFRETCPNCGSANQEAEDLVHHFSCAYVGPISDFYLKSGGHNMVCPKCEKTLNHIGVDYDKPSLIYTCEVCDHNFQNPVIKGKCHYCGADTQVEYLVKKEIRQYQLTKAGRQAADGRYRVGLNSAAGNLAGIMNDDLFHKSLSKAINRKQKMDEPSCLAALQFHNISMLYDRIGEERGNELARELHQIIQQEIATNDEAVFVNKFVARLLLLNCKKRHGRKKLTQIAAELHQLLHDNFDEFDADILVRLQPVVETETAQSQIDNLEKNSVYNDE